MSWLTDHCPRLAKARDDLVRHAAYDRATETRRTTALLEAQRVLAHRELQLVRAFSTRDDRYIERRMRKLASAQRRVDRLSTPTQGRVFSLPDPRSQT